MGRFIRGDVVVVPFPFSDLTYAKRRPALVITELEGDDIILCQITSQYVRDKYAIPIVNKDFENGGLKVKSNVRPNRLFTADKNIILYRIGHLKKNKIREVINKIKKHFRRMRKFKIQAPRQKIRLKPLRWNIDLRIEPMPIKLEDFTEDNPLASEILKNGIPLI